MSKMEDARPLLGLGQSCHWRELRPEGCKGGAGDEKCIGYKSLMRGTSTANFSAREMRPRTGVGNSRRPVRGMKYEHAGTKVTFVYVQGKR